MFLPSFYMMCLFSLRNKHPCIVIIHKLLECIVGYMQHNALNSNTPFPQWNMLGNTLYIYFILFWQRQSYYGIQFIHKQCGEYCNTTLEFPSFRETSINWECGSSIFIYGGWLMVYFIKLWLLD